MIKILLIGSKGMLGSELLEVLNNDPQYIVIPKDKSELDITNKIQVINLVQEVKPNYIVNCAAYTNVDACETNINLAMNVNGNAIENLSIAANNVDATLIQISTDYVFKGNLDISKNYTEDMEVDPVTVYGKSKLLGEQNAMKAKKYYILRTAWLYGNGKNFVRTMLNLAKTHKELNVVCDQFGSPTSCSTLCSIIKQIIEINPEYGIYHTTNEEFTNWSNFAKKIFELKGIEIKVNEVTSEEYKTAAKRPLNSKLSKEKLNKAGIYPCDYIEALKEYLNKE